MRQIDCIAGCILLHCEVHFPLDSLHGSASRLFLLALSTPLVRFGRALRVLPTVGCSHCTEERNRSDDLASVGSARWRQGTCKIIAE
jgi:hypothetical protein